MVYSYCRKIEKSEKKNKQNIDKWASKNQIKIDEYVWDDEVSQKTPFEKRSLSLYLIPKLQKGDCIVVYELSCLGRSAEELDYLFNHVFVEKEVRVICKTMCLDIDFSRIDPIHQKFLDNIAFAANLHKMLVGEVTKAALSARKASGVKLGAASEKYKEKYLKLSKEEKKEIHFKKGLSKLKNTMESPDVKAFLKILKEVFGLGDDYKNWDWGRVTTKGNYISILLKKIKEANDQQGLFSTWDLSDLDSDKLKQKVRCTIHTRKRASINYYSKFDRKHKVSENKSADKNSINITGNSQNDSTGDEITREVILDKNRLNEIENDTILSQDLLSVIFRDSEPSNDEIMTDDKALIEIMKALLSKEIWSYQEVENICKKYNLIMGAVLEQINDYSYKMIGDTIVEDDGEKIYVTTEYKDILLT